MFRFAFAAFCVLVVAARLHAADDEVYVAKFDCYVFDGDVPKEVLREVYRRTKELPLGEKLHIKTTLELQALQKHRKEIESSQVWLKLEAGKILLVRDRSRDFLFEVKVRLDGFENTEPKVKLVVSAAYAQEKSAWSASTKRSEPIDLGSRKSVLTGGFQNIYVFIAMSIDLEDADKKGAFRKPMVLQGDSMEVDNKFGKDFIQERQMEKRLPKFEKLTAN